MENELVLNKPDEKKKSSANLLSVIPLEAEVINFLPVAADKLILDACCGSRSFWFDKNNRNTIYIDIRKEKNIQADKRGGRKAIDILPDILTTFEKLPFKSESFSLVVFDPPHGFFGESGYMAKYYGRLGSSWRTILKNGFAECFRVLKTNGILIFKWNEVYIPVKDILMLATYQPLFGNKSGKQHNTHWICYMKTDRQKDL